MILALWSRVQSFVAIGTTPNQVALGWGGAG